MTNAMYSDDEIKLFDLREYRLLKEAFEKAKECNLQVFSHQGKQLDVIYVSVLLKHIRYELAVHQMGLNKDFKLNDAYHFVDIATAYDFIEERGESVFPERN